MTSYYTGDGLGFQHLGVDTPMPTPVGEEARSVFIRQGTTDAERLARAEQWDREHPNDGSVSMWARLAAIGGTLSMPVLAYHGYKRNDSIGWAFVWGFFGSWVWPIAVPVALAQGYARPARGIQRNRRRSRRRSSRRRRTSRRAA